MTTFELEHVGPLLDSTATMRQPVLAHLGENFDFDAFLDHVERLVAQEFGGRPIQFERSATFFVAHQ